MTRTLALPSAILAVAVIASGCGSKSDAASSGADVSPYVGGQRASATAQTAASTGSGSPRVVADVEPCALITKAEIIAQIEASYVPDQLAGFKSAGGTWRITPTPEQQGISKACRFALEGRVANGDVRHQMEFTLAVTDGAFVNPNVNNAKNRPIPGLGDEACFMSRGPMMPYARVGNVAVGIEGFPNTPTAKAGVDLLRAAVARIRGS